jgi:hypothetical protein
MRSPLRLPQRAEAVQPAEQAVDAVARVAEHDTPAPPVQAFPEEVSDGPGHVPLRIADDGENRASRKRFAVFGKFMLGCGCGPQPVVSSPCRRRDRERTG